MTSNILHDAVPPRDQDEDHEQNTYPPLFAGQKLWFHHQIPQRRWLVDNAKQYGATVVNLDKQADIILVDHARKNNAPGTHSYRYVELSIRRGKLEDLADHAVGLATSADRAVGSTVTAPRSGRRNFTPEEDQLLWNWIKPFEASGGPSRGNEIYKQIERVNPRHTWQSWRDRWLKVTQYQKRQLTSPAREARDRLEEQAPASSHEPRPRKRRRGVDDEQDQETVADDAQQPQHSTLTPSMRAAEQDSSSVFSQPKSEPARKVNAPQPPPQASLALPPDASGREIKRPAPSDMTSTVLAPRNPFTSEEYRQLYHLVPKLTNVSIENFHQTWKEVASWPDFNQHTAEEWENFWIRKVVPDYCHKKNMSIEQIAPYLLEQPKKNSSVPSQIREAGKDDSLVARTDSGPKLIVCGNCFTTESDKWRLDRDGNSLCNPCAVFLRTHGVPRPSMIKTGGGADNDELTLPATAKTPATTSSRRDLVNVTPLSTYVNRAVQTSLSHPQKEGGPNPPAVSRSRHPSPPPRSPSFQPESPSLDRRPEPNEARKRSAGRNTESQSTENSNDQGSQGQVQASLDSMVEFTLGEVQSKGKRAQHEDSSKTRLQEASTTTPTVQSLSKRQRTRPLLSNASKILNSEQDSYSTSDRGAPRDLPAVHLAGSEGDAVLWGRHSRPAMVFPVRSQRDDSPLFVPEHDDDDEEDGIERYQTKVNPASPSTFAASDSKVDANVDYGAPLHNTGSWTATGQSETIQESQEAWETAPENQHVRANRRTSTQQLFDNPKIGGDATSLDLELPEPEGGWDTILGSASSHLHTEYYEKSKPDVQESGTLDAGDPDADTNFMFDVEKELVLLSPPPPDILSADAEGNADDEAEVRKIDDWLTLQRRLHPGIKNILPLLFKALESTTFDLALATAVVDSMLLERKRLASRRRSGVVAADEIVVPQDMKGVWTEEDDNLLTSSNARDVERVLDKHGRKGCDARFEYLEKVADT